MTQFVIIDKKLLKIIPNEENKIIAQNTEKVKKDELQHNEVVLKKTFESCIQKEPKLKEYREWTPKATKLLIDLYKESREKVGSYAMKI